MEPFPGCSSFELLEPEVKVEQAAANETLFRQGLGAADSGQSLSSETRSWGPSGPDTTGSIQRDVENRRSSVSSAPSSSATSTVQHFPGHRYMTPEYVPPGGVADEPDTPRDEPADGRDSMADVIEAVQTKRGSKRKDKGPEEESKAWKRTARKLSPRRTMHGVSSNSRSFGNAVLGGADMGGWRAARCSPEARRGAVSAVRRLRAKAGEQP